MYLSKYSVISSISLNRTFIIANNRNNNKNYVNNIVNFDSSKIIENKENKEKYYQEIIEELLCGKHKTLKSGITDVTNGDTHAEIKHWSKWKFLVGQLLSYNNCDYKLNLHAYMFGNYSEQNKMIALDVFHKYGITPFEFVNDYDLGKLLIVNLITKKIVYEKNKN
jgi:hypothetical protein